MKEIIISEDQKNKRLDSFLKSYLVNASGGFIYKMLRKKNITLNDKKAQGTEKLKNGDSIKIYFSDDTLNKFKSDGGKTVSEEDSSKLNNIAVSVIYEDDNIVLVSKPAGLLSQKAQAGDISLNDWLIQYLLENGSVTKDSLELYKPSICNRLDRNTSGLVICAKSLSGARIMNEMLRDRTLDKYYRTIVAGKLSDKVKLKGYLYKDEKKNKVIIKDNDPHDDNYSYIETEYDPLDYSKEMDMTLLEVKLITGKPHQIRAHLADIGHPIIGDVKYGGRKIGKLNHQLLHSYRIKFPQDMDNELGYLAGKEYVANLPEAYDRYFGKG